MYTIYANWFIFDNTIYNKIIQYGFNKIFMKILETVLLASVQHQFGMENLNWSCNFLPYSEIVFIAKFNS